MTITLTPVIEILRISDSIRMPDKGPYWEYPHEWSEYKRQCLADHGFSDLKPYLKASDLYEVSTIKGNDLLLQIKSRINDIDSEEDILPFDGGYILEVDREKLLCPQCCSDLGNIKGWMDLVEGDSSSWWEGHPQADIKIKEDKIFFDLTVGELDEQFTPPPPKEVFEIDRLSLKVAVNDLVDKLQEFAIRINEINDRERLGFENLAKLLIGEGSA